MKQTERLIIVLMGFLALAIWRIPAESRGIPESIQLELQRGDAYVIEGKLNDAARIYQGILKQDATSAEAYRGLGLVSWTRGVVGEALQYYRKALTLNPTFVEAHTDLALEYWATSQSNRTLRVGGAERTRFWPGQAHLW